MQCLPSDPAFLRQHLLHAKQQHPPALLLLQYTHSPESTRALCSIVNPSLVALCVDSAVEPVSETVLDTAVSSSVSSWVSTAVESSSPNASVSSSTAVPHAVSVSPVSFSVSLAVESSPRSRRRCWRV